MVLRDTAALLALRLRDYHPLWCGFPGHLDFSLQIAVCGPYNPDGAETPPVWAGPRSLATTWGVTVVFLSSGYLDVSVPRVGPNRLCIQRKVTGLQPARFSHSEIHGSQGICPSPWLIAAYHVLHRLIVPRHPPCALTNFASATRLVSAFRVFRLSVLLDRTSSSHPRMDRTRPSILLRLSACQRTRRPALAVVPTHRPRPRGPALLSSRR